VNYIALPPARRLRHTLVKLLTAGLASDGRAGALHYLLAGVLVAIAGYVRVLMAAVVPGIPYLSFFPATALAAILGGLGPGLFATVLSTVLVSYLFAPPFAPLTLRLTPELLFADLIFLVGGVLTSSAIHLMRKYHRNYVQAMVELRVVTQAEQRLERVAELLRKTGEIGRIGGWHLDLGTRRLTCSDEIFRISDMEFSPDPSVEQFIGCFVPEVRPAIYGAIRDAIRRGRNWDIETPYVTARGALLWVRTQGAAIFDSGRVVALAGAIQNITERKHIELALRNSENEYRALAESMPQIVWTALANGGASYFNQQWYDYTGLTPDESTDFGWSTAIHPDDLSSTWGLWRSAIIGRHEFSSECRLRRIDGTYRWWLIRSTPLCGACGTVQKWFGTCTDIEEMKNLEQELRIAATAFDSQEGVIITDANSTILKVNHAFSEITGYAPEEAIGQTPRLLRSGLHDKDFYAALWRCVERYGTWQGEVTDRRKNGEIFPNWLTVAAVRDGDGRITHYIGRMTDISMGKATEEKVRNMMFIDPLTQLPNLRNLQDNLRTVLQASAHTGMFGAVLLIDLDDFKALNNRLGHDVGDLLLVEVAQRLQGHLRTGDMVARLGTDQFLMLLPDMHPEMEATAAVAESVAHRIRSAISQPYSLNDQTVRVTACVGVTLFSGAAHSSDELLKLVEMALGRAKTDGRNTQCILDPKIRELVIAHEHLVQEFHHALSLDQLELHFQVQADGRQRYVGAEALIRWRHPELGLVPPAKFIPLAEESGLIIPIGQWVLETACARIRQWQETRRLDTLVLAINVSTRQFRQRDFVSQVVQALEASAIDPTRLKLELTESSVVADIEDAIEKMQVLKRYGVSFSLDDFGTGYSSLAYLSRLPLDQLKIDQSFVRNIGKQHSDGVIVQTIIGMARSLGMEVIAEGVETEEQRVYLEQHGCTLCQGYLFSKPLPLPEFEALLAAGESL
jgi:diguanylate cyclase (GGDEF)-like protein/PAS domain S-box-containing protein